MEGFTVSPAENVMAKLANMLGVEPEKRVVVYACRMQESLDRDYFFNDCAGNDTDYINGKFQKFLAGMTVEQASSAKDSEVVHQFLIENPEIRFMDMDACRILLPEEVCRLPQIAG